jgi:putative ABC transport system substrate-binding protein
MKSTRWLIAGVLIAAVVVAIVLTQSHRGGGATGDYRIGVLQVVRHPVLDAMATEFQTELKSKLPKAKFETFVADGDATKTEQMAEKLATGRYDLIYVIGTNQAQSLAKKTSTVPIVLGAATDPEAAGLVASWEKPGKNITGTSDLSPVGSQLDRLAQILPQAKRIGIIYNPGEDNSAIIVKRFKAECEKRHLRPVPATITDQNQIRQSAISLVGKADVIYAPTDATLQSAFPVLIKTADEVKIPVFSCDEGTAKKGAIFSVGFSYTDLGRIAADMSAEILLRKSSPSAMPIRLADKLFYNEAQITKLGLTLPAVWKTEGKLVAE